MERSLDFVILLDIYGELLANSQREALDMRYNADLSLAEIAEEMGGVTRQSVVSAIKKGEQRLEELEQKLGFAAQNSFGGAGSGVRTCFLNEAGKQRPAP